MLTNKEKRIKRVRSKIHGTADRPRLAIYRTNMQISGQVIDDEKGITLVSAYSRELAKDKKLTKLALAEETGKLIAQKIKDKKIKSVVFDRRSYRFMGRVKVFCDGVKSQGVQI